MVMLSSITMKDNLAKDIMTREVVVATPETTIEDTIKLLVNHRITGLPVVDGSRKLVGIVSEYDIICSLGKDGWRTEIDPSWLKKTIPAKTKDKVGTVGEDETLENVVEQFMNTKNRRLPVVSPDGKLVGMITRRDIIRLLFYRSRLP